MIAREMIAYACIFAIVVGLLVVAVRWRTVAVRDRDVRRQGRPRPRVRSAEDGE